MVQYANNQWQSLVEEHLCSAKRPLLVILGPTASGKTGFSLECAKYINLIESNHPAIPAAEVHVPPLPPRHAEIINADSRQLYRFLNVGTAKITPEEMQGIPHHLFDVLDPTEEVTVAWYKKEAERTIEEILARGHVPILVGGSMLYISAIIDGLDPLPPVNPALRKKLEAEYDLDRGQSLYKRLEQIDPETAGSFHSNNKPYLIRAMEIYEATGERPSALKKQLSSRSDDNVVVATENEYDLLIFGMHWSREELTKRIEERTQLLLQHGWIEEVQHLREMGYDEKTPAMKSHGYREIFERLETGDWRLVDLKLDLKLIEDINAKTRQYAKRQTTWWKGDERIHWINPQ